MLISHKKKFVVFAPWKTASQTMRLRLGKYDENPYSPMFEFNVTLNRVIHQHLTCSDFEALPEAKLNYFKASFVRNPYDRVYSGFIQIQRDLRDQPGFTYSPLWLRDLVLAQLNENQLRLDRARSDFDTWWASIPEYLIFEAGRNTNFPLHPAHYWTHLNQQPYVNFVGKVESFEADFTHLCRRLELADPAAGNANVTTETTGCPGEGQYRYTSRMSRASIAKINALFRADFEIFGYRPLPG